MRGALACSCLPTASLPLTLALRSHRQAMLIRIRPQVLTLRSVSLQSYSHRAEHGTSILSPRCARCPARSLDWFPWQR